MYLSVVIILVCILILDVSEFIISIWRKEDEKEEEQPEDYY